MPNHCLENKQERVEEQSRTGVYFCKRININDLTKNLNEAEVCFAVPGLKPECSGKGGQEKSGGRGQTKLKGNHVYY